MPKLTCLCGESINLSLIPNPHGFKLIWEPAIETLVENLTALYQEVIDRQQLEKRVYEMFFAKDLIFPQLYECSSCGQLAVFAHASDSSPAFWFQRQRIGKEDIISLSSLVQPVDEDR